VARERDEGPPGEREGGLARGGSREGRDGEEARRPGERAEGPGEPARKPRIGAGQVAVLLLALVFGIFALVNSHPVRFSWLFGETQVTRDASGEVSGGVPLIVLLLVSFILGAGLGGWWTWHAGRTRRLAAGSDEGQEKGRAR
jgi:uncharacterized integral membrane protein